MPVAVVKAYLHFSRVQGVTYPVFKRFGIPVTLHVATYHVFDHRPVFDAAFRYLFWKAAASRKVELRVPLGGDGQPLCRASERDEAATRVCAIRPASRTGLGRLPTQPRACLDATGGDRSARPS